MEPETLLPRGRLRWNRSAPAPRWPPCWTSPTTTSLSNTAGPSAALRLGWRLIPCPGKARTTVRRSTLPMGSSPAPAHFASSGPRAKRTPSRLTFPRRSSRFIRRLTPPGSTPIFPPPGGASWPFSGLPAGAKRPLQTSAASPKDWSTVWKPPSVPAPPTTNFWTLSPPSATPGRGCAASPWTPRWAAPPTVSPPFRPISICWEGRRMLFLY